MTLKEARFFKGVNQWDLSIKTKISQSKISLIENGYVEPSGEEKALLAEALGYEANTIFPVE